MHHAQKLTKTFNTMYRHQSGIAAKTRFPINNYIAGNSNNNQRSDIWSKISNRSQYGNNVIPLNSEDVPSAFRRNVSDFLTLTSMHGGKYILWKQWKIRIFWLFCLLFSFGFLSYLVFNLLMKNLKTLLLINVENTHEPISPLPFPAVTICTNVRVDKNQLKKQLGDIRFLPKSNETGVNVSDVLYLMYRENIVEHKHHKMESYISGIQSYYNSHKLDMAKLLWRVTPELLDIFLKCKWLGKAQDCSRLFQTSMTDMGKCYSFNNVKTSKRKNRTITDVERDFRNLRKTNSTGPLMGLSVIMDSMIASSTLQQLDFSGFKILIHQPGEYPQVKEKGFILKSGANTYAAVTAEKVETSDPVMEMSESRRECIVKNESPLKLMDVYSFGNCILECKIGRMMKVCKCVPYNFHFMKYGTHTSLCNYDQLFCLLNYSAILKSGSSYIQPGTNIEEPNCSCPIACMPSVRFRAEVTSADLQGHSGFKITKFDKVTTNNQNLSEFTQLHVFFKEFFYMKYGRHKKFTWFDIVASIGGIIGLGVGMSLISFCEIFYFLLWKPVRSMFGRKPVTASVNSNHSLNNERYHQNIAW